MILMYNQTNVNNDMNTDDVFGQQPESPRDKRIRIKRAIQSHMYYLETLREKSSAIYSDISDFVPMPNTPKYISFDNITTIKSYYIQTQYPNSIIVKRDNVGGIVIITKSKDNIQLNALLDQYIDVWRKIVKWRTRIKEQQNKLKQF